MNTSGALVTIDTKNYQIDGKKGNWAAADTVIIDGKQFYLMEQPRLTYLYDRLIVIILCFTVNTFDSLHRIFIFSI